MYALSPLEKWIPGYESKYYATKSGKIFNVYKSGNKRELKGYRRANVYCVKLTDTSGHCKELMFNRIIWETFKGPIPNGYIVTRKTSVLTENSLQNLRVVSKKQHGAKTGPKSRSKEVVLLNDDGEIVNFWTSARKAAKDLFVSHQTVNDVCNGKVQKPLINVRWARSADFDYPKKACELKEVVKLRVLKKSPTQQRQTP